MAGHCPFCNWDQRVAAPPPEEVASAPNPAALYTPPEEFSIKKLVIMASGFVAMLIAAFVFGMLINRDGAPDRAPETVAEQAAEHNAKNQAPKRANTPLVPAGQGGIDQNPITSAPVAAPPGQAPNDYQRTDATAVSADEYAQMARQAQAEKKKKMTVLVDPRSITGPAYAQGMRTAAQRPRSTAAAQRPTPIPGFPGMTPPPAQNASQQGGPQLDPAETPQPVRRASVRTRPVPQYQPLPPVRGRGTARFTLTIGADGRVKDVDIEQTMVGGNTPALIGAIQNWRFKPATENGEPVAAPFSVEISFKP